MPHDPNAFAEMVTLTIKAALTPVLERVAGLEARLTQALAIEPSVSSLRDRVVAIEVKAALPTPELPANDDELSDAVSQLDTKLQAFQERLGTVETKAATVAPAPVQMSAAEIQLLINDACLPLTKTLAALQERVAVVETRAPIPGPAGEKGADGANGTNGKDGKDGADGLGFDDLLVEQDGERSVAVKAVKGDRMKTIGTLTFPVDIYRGVYAEGKTYERGDCVTWGGSEWHCNDTTATKPGDGQKAWTLKVKRGRDGRDGRDADPPAPVVSLGR